MNRYSPYTGESKSLELLVGCSCSPGPASQDEVIIPVMTNRYMGAFQGTRDMTNALYLAVPQRLEQRLQTNAQDFDKEERKDQKPYQQHTYRLRASASG